jgi:hypothetical protein
MNEICSNPSRFGGNILLVARALHAPQRAVSSRLVLYSRSLRTKRKESLTQYSSIALLLVSYSLFNIIKLVAPFLRTHGLVKSHLAPPVTTSVAIQYLQHYVHTYQRSPDRSPPSHINLPFAHHHDIGINSNSPVFVSERVSKFQAVYLIEPGMNRIERWGLQKIRVGNAPLLWSRRRRRRVDYPYQYLNRSASYLYSHIDNERRSK